MAIAMSLLSGFLSSVCSGFFLRFGCCRFSRNTSLLLVATAFFTGFFGRTLFDAYAKENRTDSLNRYYTSIRLKPGDNLWNIASRYAEGSEYTVAEYVQELKRMNNLRDEQVHSGEYLTIVYFSE